MASRALQSTIPCEQYALLLETHRKAVSLLGLAIDLVGGNNSTIDDSQLEQLRSYINEARLRSQATRWRLAQHAQEHGCC